VRSRKRKIKVDSLSDCEAGKNLRLLELRHTSGPPLQCILIHLCVSHSRWRNAIDTKVDPTHSLAATCDTQTE
jgi:hypothetical protein